MYSLSNTEIKKIVKSINDEIVAEKIILFGSSAKGQINENSDIDILIIDRDDFNEKRNRRKELRKIREALSFIRYPKDILLYSKTEMDFWKDSVNHIIARSLKEGSKIYERS